MRATVWSGRNKVQVENVPDPKILNDRDAIVKISSTAICGSDLHLYDGYIPAMVPGDILGHEFMGEVVEVGSGVGNLSTGDRVVVPFPIACGSCGACRRELYSVCENSNPNAAFAEKIMGHSPCGIFGYSHLTGGYAGGQAEYVRVPFADVGPLKVDDDLTDDQVLFLSDIIPTGYMGADMCDIKPGDVVAVWGAGGVGQMAARAAMLLGAERVVVIDRYPERLQQVTRHIGAEVLDYTADEVLPALRELSGGRGPDVCIEAVGMEAHSNRPDYLYDQVKQQLRMQTDRPTAVREAIMACRKGGSVFVLGVFGALVDKFPLGALMNKGLRFGGAQQHGQRYIPMLLERMASGELTTEHLATHVMSLDEAPQGYEMFKEKTDGCVRAVFQP